jgi:protein-tyrosine-phosphatase|tara:strand:+ start:642 stop:779 length:138 start_codon:yes stop_codon:yes gene_type:complete
MKKKNVLFRGNPNSARSHIAEAILNSLQDEKSLAFSAGLDPAELS